MKILNELEAALAAATPLDLVIGEDPVDVLDEKGDFFATTLAPEFDVATQQDYDNAKLIALMKNSLPALIECAKAMLALGDAFDIAQRATSTSAIGKYRAALAKLEKQS